MNFSKHAESRCQQRAIPKDEVELIIQFGKPQHKPNGAIEYCVDKSERHRMCIHLKHLLNRINKLHNKAVLILDNQVITVYHKNH